jgi:osmotically-inducible protein OsmY
VKRALAIATYHTKRISFSSDETKAPLRPARALHLYGAAGNNNASLGGVMADRYEDRYRGEDWHRDRGFGREFNRDERGPFERTGDEVRSWFGDEEAARRRRMDEARYGRDWDRYGRGDADRNWDYRASPRDWEDRGVYGRDWDYGHRMGFDYSRGPRSWGAERPGSGERFERYEMNRPGHGWFTGRGPRGYQRSDDRIREDVCDRLADDPWVDAGDIEVTVRAGEVTLSGNVRERSDKRRVEDVIENVSGVREVHNNLHVGTSREPATTAGAATAGLAAGPLHAY